MDVANHYSEFLSTFIALIIAGVAIKFALSEKSGKNYELNGKLYSKDKVHNVATLALLGVVIQLVSDSIKVLDGKPLILDEKILAAYGIAIATMVFKK
ncbi:MAG: hypothetical protein KDI92_08375 [Xanthomonadales bacterium]|nr:hypothetical protein [Xanthomonadales bacterium]